MRIRSIKDVMADWCDFYDMPADGCSHCTGRTGQPDMSDVEISHTFIARYPGRCDCDRTWQPGETIGRTVDGEYVCGRCAG